MLGLAGALAAPPAIAAGPAAPLVLPKLALSIALAEAENALLHKDYPSAVRYLTTAVELKDASAMGNLAFLYAEGLGVARDDAKALDLFQRAVAGGAILPKDKLEALQALEANLSRPPATPAPATASPAGPVDPATAAFASATRIGTVRAYQLFLVAHPGGPLAEEAQTRLRTLLLAQTAKLSPAAAEALLTHDSGLAERVQVALNAAGIGVGEPDGSIGGQTRAGIRAFQNRSGLTVTGYLSVDLARLLAVPLFAWGDTLASAAPARPYRPSDMAVLETDPRLMRAVATLSGSPIVYGTLGGHVYIGVLGSSTPASRQARAKASGGYLVSIGSKQENDFVFRLAAADARFFDSYSEDDGSLSVVGPFIGIAQSATAREPTGGWLWASGEKAVFTRWAEGEPNDFRKMEDAAVFMAHDQKRSAPLRDVSQTWGDVVDDGGSGYVIEID
jgi:hypothetical protein